MGFTLGIATEPKLPPTSVHRSQPLVAAGVLARIAGPLMLEGRAKVLGVEAQTDRIIETLESRLSGRLQLKARVRGASGQNPVTSRAVSKQHAAVDGGLVEVGE